jgi:glycosyl-4,4'-diaponeurosporenoate acyltransferase
LQKLLNLSAVWFRPKRFESERLYVLLGARLLKRYLPTGGDVVMRWLRHRDPNYRLLDRTPESMRRLEQSTRIAETVHLASFLAFSVLAVRRASTGTLARFPFAFACTLNFTLGLWPVVLQRYNRLRIYRAIDTATRTAAR